MKLLTQRQIGFLASVGIFSMAITLIQAPQVSSVKADPNKCELVIVDSGLGGVAAALQAVRNGVRTCMTSMTDWIGGQMTTQGVSAIDGPYHYSGRKAPGDLEFFKRYTKVEPGKNSRITPNNHPYLAYERYFSRPHEEEVLRTMMPFLRKAKPNAKCWVSNYCFRPSDGDKALKDLLQPYVSQGLLTIYYETVPKRVIKNDDGDLITTVEFVQRKYTGVGSKPYTVRLSEEISDWYSEVKSARYNKKSLKLSGNIFMDATETGELIVLSGANHRLGFIEGEQDYSKGQLSQSQTNPFVRKIEPECVMGYVYPSNLEAKAKVSAKESAWLKKIKPYDGMEPFAAFDGNKFKFWWDDPKPTRTNLSIFEYRRISNTPAVTMMNWGPLGNDYQTGNFIVPSELMTDDDLANWKGGVRVDELRKAEDRSLLFVDHLNSESRVKFKGRGVVPITNINATNNFFGTGTGLSKFPYVRDSRRMEGFNGFWLTEKMVGTSSRALGTFLKGSEYTHFYDSVGIGSYPIDTRACPNGRDIGTGNKLRYVNHAQIPLRALVSSNIKNLMAANKNYAQTQLVNAGMRLHPTEWNAGFGSGTAAAVAIQANVTPHELLGDINLIQKTQKLVVKSAGRVMWFSDKIPSELPESMVSPSELTEEVSAEEQVEYVPGNTIEEIYEQNE